MIENALAAIARGLVELGVGRLIVAGRETSGAVVKALGALPDPFNQFLTDVASIEQRANVLASDTLAPYRKIMGRPETHITAFRRRRILI